MSSEAIALWTETSSDPELIAGVRAGDTTAFGLLYERHADAARKVATQYTNTAADVDDVVSESFSRVLRALQRGDGPDLAFRAYLFTIVRRTGMDMINKGIRTKPREDMGEYEANLGYEASSDEPALEGFEHGMVAGAFKSLPERWQAVLWYTEVEKKSPKEIAPLLGLSANGVAALAYRAREALRQAYLQQHLNSADTLNCLEANTQLGAYVRGGLNKREHSRIDEHVKDCERCTALVLELQDVNRGMRGIIAPIVLGTLGMGALQGGLPVGGAFGSGGTAGASSAGAAGAGAATGSSTVGASGLAAAFAGASSFLLPAAAVVGVAAIAIGGASFLGLIDPLRTNSPESATPQNVGDSTGSTDAGATPGADDAGAADDSLADGDDSRTTGPGADGADSGSGDSSLDGNPGANDGTGSAPYSGPGNYFNNPSVGGSSSRGNSGASGSGSGSSVGAGTGAGSGSATGSGSGATSGAGTGSETGSDNGSGSGSGAGAGDGNGDGTGDGSETGSGADSGTDSGAGSGTGAGDDGGTDSGSGSGTGTGTDPGDGGGTTPPPPSGSANLKIAKAPLDYLRISRTSPSLAMSLNNDGDGSAEALSAVINLPDGLSFASPSGGAGATLSGTATRLESFMRFATDGTFVAGDWTCTLSGDLAADVDQQENARNVADCTLDALAAGAGTELDLPLDLNGASIGDHAKTAFTVTAGDLTVSYEVDTGIEDNDSELDPGYTNSGGQDFVQVGAPLMGCDVSKADCLQKMTFAGDTTQGSFNNNGQKMVPLNDAQGAVSSSTTHLVLPEGAVVKKAILEWSANRSVEKWCLTANKANCIPASAITESQKQNRTHYQADQWTTAAGDTTASLSDSARFRVPNGNYANVSADTITSQVLDSREYYVARKDVTSLVSSAGTGEYALADIALPATSYDPDYTYYGGYALTVVYESADLAPSRVAIFDGAHWVSSSTNAEIRFSTAGAATAHVGWVAWEGDRASTGDKLTLDGTAMRPIKWDGTRAIETGDRQNAADSTATGSRYANSLGVDVKPFEDQSLSGAGQHTLSVSTSGDNFLISTVAVRITDN
ncbi:sigma-70 family RNA polymerase sigma factor [Demequina oxidasica]|uniref:sigma-70 family RNA polymerase sigma factor n=1 Tax=Demequina oxidasica TaxID=676199 RepID=UPI000A0356B0|nr:sigma-70 family RNA polymerase sigma factor [Demequina oxidasica]